MFFIMGISQKKKRLDYAQMAICANCGRLSQVEVYMVYQYFMFFFIPLFKWGKQYFAVSNCCHSAVELPREIGSRIERGESVTLEASILSGGIQAKACDSCGFQTVEDFDYCPKCGAKLR